MFSVCLNPQRTNTRVLLGNFSDPLKDPTNRNLQTFSFDFMSRDALFYVYAGAFLQGLRTWGFRALVPIWASNNWSRVPGHNEYICGDYKENGNTRCSRPSTDTEVLIVLSTLLSVQASIPYRSFS